MMIKFDGHTYSVEHPLLYGEADILMNSENRREAMEILIKNKMKIDGEPISDLGAIPYCIVMEGIKALCLSVEQLNFFRRDYSCAVHSDHENDHLDQAGPQGSPEC